MPKRPEDEDENEDDYEIVLAPRTDPRPKALQYEGENENKWGFIGDNPYCLFSNQRCTLIYESEGHLAVAEANRLRMGG